MLGLSFPIWTKPQIAQIQANAILKNIAQSDLELHQKNLQGQYTQAFQAYVKYKSSLVYFETNALKMVDLITNHALQNYQSGNIGYIELSQSLNRALDIQSNYLSTLNQYNQSIINIEYLIGTNE